MFLKFFSKNTPKDVPKEKNKDHIAPLEKPQPTILVDQDLSMVSLAQKLTIHAKTSVEYLAYYTRLQDLIVQAISNQDTEKLVYQALADTRDTPSVYSALYDVAQQSSYCIAKNNIYSQFMLAPYIRYTLDSENCKIPSFLELQDIFRNILLEKKLINRPENFYLGNVSQSYEALSQATFGVIRFLNELVLKEGEAVDRGENIETFYDKVLPNKAFKEGLDVAFLCADIVYEKNEKVLLLEKIKENDDILKEVFQEAIWDKVNQEYTGNLWDFYTPNIPRVLLDTFSHDEMLVNSLFNQHPEYSYALSADMTERYLAFWENGKMIGYCLLHDANINVEAYVNQKATLYGLDFFYVSENISLKEVLKSDFNPHDFIEKIISSETP